MSAPERIWLSRGWANTFTDPDDFPCGEAYILATPEALAAAPEVQRLIAEAEERVRESVWGETVMRTINSLRVQLERAECAAMAAAFFGPTHSIEKRSAGRDIAAAIRNRKETT